MATALTGAEKAVLFLLSLEESVAMPIVAELGDEELRVLHKTATQMRGVPGGALEDTYREFLAASRAAVAVPRGGVGYIKRLSTAVFGEDRVERMLEGPITPIGRLETADPDALGALLAKEPPRIAGAVLSRMKPAAAAEVLSTMPLERQAAVIAHVGRLTELDATAMDEVASVLADDLPNAKVSPAVDVDGTAKAAEILNAFGRDAARTLLGQLETTDPDLSAQVRQSMFTFEDLVRLGAREMRELLRALPTDRLTIALKGASEALMEAVFAGLSSRAADLIKDDLEVLGNVKRSEIEAARREVVQVALTLESEGKLELNADAG